MKKASETEVVRGFNVGQNKVEVSHLQFADDGIFFVQNEDRYIENLKGILKVFSFVSGLSINLSKSVVVGLNLETDRLSNIALDLGCVSGEWPLTYLGLPLGGNPNSMAFWEPVIERVSKRIEGWHKSCLSRGGKLILLQSVLGSIPIYYLSVFKIPKKAAKLLEKLMRDFFWEGFGERKGNHLVNWDEISKSKLNGGLGVGNIIKKNMALLGKWLWRFPLERDSLWHSVIQSKYGAHSNGWDAGFGIRGTSRAPWKSISRVWIDFMQNIKLVVGVGNNIRFWEDIWVGSRPLKDLFPRIFRLSCNQNMLIQMVSSWSPSFYWDLSFRRNLNDREFVEFTAMMELIQSVSLNQNYLDKRSWVAHSSGSFSCKSFFDVLSQSSQSYSVSLSKFIWKHGVPTKIKVFAWLALKGKVNTCDVVQKRRPFWCLSPSWCVLCKRFDESIDHILLHCGFVRWIWAGLFKAFGVVGAMPKKWLEFVEVNWHFNKGHGKARDLWRFAVLAVAWGVWMERNKRTFEEKSSSVEDLWDHTLFLTELWARVSGILDCSECFLFRIDCNSFLVT
ncbi:hypothetical protein LguiB_022207 [Lonicera macranthoides]